MRFLRKFELKRRYGGRIEWKLPYPSWDDADSIWRNFGAAELERTHFINLASQPMRLEAMVDPALVHSHCDLVASHSTLARFLTEHKSFTHADFWRQDARFATDHRQAVIGGYPQDLWRLAPRRFDLITMTSRFNSLSHPSDGEVVSTMDQVLSPIGVFLILPIYLSLRAKVVFDPTTTLNEDIANMDPDALWVAARRPPLAYERRYDPRSFATRLLSRLPQPLDCTLIRFAPVAGLTFALAFHRKNTPLLQGPSNGSGS